ncbi:long-chain fatty acid--CoA ligase [Dactylosporangium sp. NPDC051541]|uniref:long-chain fatty acid--CoA ligase n=1 Tax=Dactylosporangium sp. NPDC051541 TaxID=3363977 RepID=UPI0037B1309A
MSATLSLAAVLAESARKYPRKIAVVDGEQRVTYETLWREALTCAASLRERGVRPGDRVAVQIPNVVDFPRVYFGALALGAVVVPVHLLLTADEVAYTLRDSDARLLICHPSQAVTGQAAAELAGVPVIAPADLLGAEPLPTYASRAPEDAAVVLYTSGTTGEPKGAVLTHLNLVMNTVVNVFDANDARSSDVVLGCLPLFHTFGQTVGMNGTFRLGATLVMLARFTGDAALDVMVRENVTVFHGVPTMYVALLAAAEGRAQLPQLRLCISGGAALPLAVLEKFNAAFGTNIFEGYGLSETSPTATTNQPHFGTRAGTVGHAIWGVEVEIARPEIEERVELLPAGTLGEIVIRGHNVFAGYLNRPDDTAQAVVDGWFRSGDLGTKDADGFITIVDRKKDLVIRGGFNVYPREVEEAVARHPAVMQVAVIGVPDSVHGEEICAVVVRDPAVPLSEDELIEWSKERLGRHKYPRRVHFVEELPLGPSHKVLKRELRRSFS